MFFASLPSSQLAGRIHPAKILARLKPRCLSPRGDLIVKKQMVLCDTICWATTSLVPGSLGNHANGRGPKRNPDGSCPPICRVIAPGPTNGAQKEASKQQNKEIRLLQNDMDSMGFLPSA